MDVGAGVLGGPARSLNGLPLAVPWGRSSRLKLNWRPTHFYLPLAASLSLPSPHPSLHRQGIKGRTTEAFPTFHWEVSGREGQSHSRSDTGLSPAPERVCVSRSVTVNTQGPRGVAVAGCEVPPGDYLKNLKPPILSPNPGTPPAPPYLQQGRILLQDVGFDLSVFHRPGHLPAVLLGQDTRAGALPSHSSPASQPFPRFHTGSGALCRQTGFPQHLHSAPWSAHGTRAGPLGERDGFFPLQPLRATFPLPPTSLMSTCSMPPLFLRPLPLPSPLLPLNGSP